MKVFLKLIVVFVIIIFVGFGLFVSVQMNYMNISYCYFDDGVVFVLVVVFVGLVNYLIGCEMGCDIGCNMGCDFCGCDLGGLFSCCCGFGELFQFFGFGCSGIEVGGWMQIGYYDNVNGFFNNYLD